MRIGIIAGEYPPLQGGLGDYTRELARALSEAGHEPHVLCRFVEGASAIETTQLGPHGLTVHRLISQWDWQTRRRIEGFVRAYKPDVLNLQYQAAAYQMHPAINLLPAALNKSVPTVVTFHDLREPYLFPKAGSFRRKAILGMARGAAATVVTNVEDRDDLLREKIANVFLIPIGSNIAPADLATFDGAAWRAAKAIPESTTLIGYFGFMNESKGGETLVRALAELRGRGLNAAVLQIGGQTGASDPTNIAYAERLRALAEQLSVREHIYQTGFVDERGVSEAFANCALMALPYRDGVSFRRGTLMAALAHAKAIVTTTPRLTLPEVRDGTNVLLVPPDNPSALATAIARALSDEALRANLQTGAQALSKLFQWDYIAGEMGKVFVKCQQ
jgi:glycosyltransferase involved in cell wall biosynthesis